MHFSVLWWIQTDLLSQQLLASYLSKAKIRKKIKGIVTGAKHTYLLWWKSCDVYGIDVIIVCRTSSIISSTLIKKIGFKVRTQTPKHQWKDEILHISKNCLKWQMFIIQSTTHSVLCFCAQWQKTHTNFARKPLPSSASTTCISAHLPLFSPSLRLVCVWLSRAL